MTHTLLAHARHRPRDAPAGVPLVPKVHGGGAEVGAVLAEPRLPAARLAVGRRARHHLRRRELVDATEDAAVTVHARAREDKDTGGRGRRRGRAVRLSAEGAPAALAHVTNAVKIVDSLN
jgi:hypothetical protein